MSACGPVLGPVHGRPADAVRPSCAPRAARAERSIRTRCSAWSSPAAAPRGSRRAPRGALLGSSPRRRETAGPARRARGGRRSIPDQGPRRALALRLRTHEGHHRPPATHQGAVARGARRRVRPRREERHHRRGSGRCGMASPTGREAVALRRRLRGRPARHRTPHAGGLKGRLAGGSPRWRTSGSLPSRIGGVERLSMSRGESWARRRCGLHRVRRERFARHGGCWRSRRCRMGPGGRRRQGPAGRSAGPRATGLTATIRRGSWGLRTAGRPERGRDCRPSGRRRSRPWPRRAPTLRRTRWCGGAASTRSIGSERCSAGRRTSAPWVEQLGALGYRRLSVRPQHRGVDPGAQASPEGTSARHGLDPARDGAGQADRSPAPGRGPRRRQGAHPRPGAARHSPARRPRHPPPLGPPPRRRLPGPRDRRRPRHALRQRSRR